MNIVAFIPARSGSKSIPDKNIKLLGGKPLIAWTIESAFKSGINRVIVSTDSENYAMVAKAYGAEVLMRPSHLAQDNTSTFDVLRSEVFKIEPLPDLVMLLQPTSPFREKVIVKSAISYLKENLKDYDSLISVERVPEKYNPYAVIIENQAGKGMLFRKLFGFEKIKSWFTGKKYIGPNLSGYPINQRLTRRQDLPQAWLPDGAIYLFKTKNLKQGSFYGEKVMLLENKGTLNLNTLEEWKEAEKLIEKK